MFSTYLNFNGTCAEAFRFYERCFGGKIEFLQTFGDSPMKESVTQTSTASSCMSR